MAPKMVRDRAKAVAASLFRVGERAGLHVLPVHYYSSIASRRWLRANEALWRKPAALPGLRWDLEEQTKWLTETVGDYPAELPLAAIHRDAEAVGGFRYGPIEAQMLHSVIRRHAPRRVVELGSGSTTLLMSRAVARNVAEGRDASKITAVDPYGHPALADLPHVTFRRAGGLELDLDQLALERGDLLFIDSTHVVKTGSEVPYLYIDLLPRLAAGVLVQVHDIYLPYLYSRRIYDEFFDWQETTLVAALLTNNERLEVLACMSALHDARRDALSAAFPEYRPQTLLRGINAADEPPLHFPSSLWMRTAG